jgi:GTP-binding protein HflX
MPKEVKVKPRRAVVATVHVPGVSDIELESSLTELRELAKTLGYEVVQTFVQKRANFDATAYLGAGKREEIRRFVQGEPLEGEDGEEGDEAAPAPAKRRTGVGRAAAKTARHGLAAAKEDAKQAAATDEDKHRADVALIDHEISPSQARNLEDALGCEVMDRTMVILEIFHRHARTNAARAQVEIARLGYLAPRLREAAKLAGPQGRQRSGVGGRGAGEGAGEADRRKIRDRIAELKLDIAAMDVERQTQRARRQERQSLARVALVGYTNAGKSTLMRALTGSEVLVENKLFATLDTTVRTLHPETVPRVLVSDTEGFIKNLPHDLVASFKSTLEEAAEASLLLHVIDASDPGYERQIYVTDDVLKEIGADRVPRIRVFNKVDGVGDAKEQKACEKVLRARYPKCVVMSALRQGDVVKLHKAIAAFFQKGLVKAELRLPWSAQQSRGEIFANCEVLEERADEEGATFRVRGEPETIRSLKERFGQP